MNSPGAKLDVPMWYMVHTHKKSGLSDVYIILTSNNSPFLFTLLINDFKISKVKFLFGGNPNEVSDERDGLGGAVEPTSFDLISHQNFTIF